MNNENIHSGHPVLQTGTPIEQAKAAMILIHGRGASAEDILLLAQEFNFPQIIHLAPQATGNTWYPYSFLEPIEKNEPGISSGLQIIKNLIDQLNAQGIAEDKIILLGFSQGACLALEFAARNARKYGGIVGLSGGLIGPDGTPRDYQGSFQKTPVFLGCSDPDFHIPAERVHLTAEVFERMDATVIKRLYPGLGHTVNQDEIDAVKNMIRNLI